MQHWTDALIVSLVLAGVWAWQAKKSQGLEGFIPAEQLQAPAPPPRWAVLLVALTYLSPYLYPPVTWELALRAQTDEPN